jgi:hypothetical protein
MVPTDGVRGCTQRFADDAFALDLRKRTAADIRGPPPAALAVWEAHGCASLPPMVSERGPGHRDVTAVPAAAVPVRRGGVLHATTGGGLDWNGFHVSASDTPLPLCAACRRRRCCASAVP